MTSLDSSSLQLSESMLNFAEPPSRSKDIDVRNERSHVQKGQKAAKIYLTLTRGNVNILDLELRYKGSFTSQPQFLGTLNDQYKLLLEKECGV